MGKYNRENVLRLIRDEDVQFIRMQFTDLFGQLKNVAVTASQTERALDGEVMLDGSSIQGFVRVEESDQFLQPDLDTFAILPWRPQLGKVARLICDVYEPDGPPFAGDPRDILKHVMAQAENRVFQAGVEPKFFSSRRRRTASPTPGPPTRRAASTWAPWTTGRASAGRRPWPWRTWASRWKPATTGPPPDSTRST